MGLILLLVVFSAVFVAFSDDINSGIKKIFSVHWVRVLAPIMIASFVWVWFDEEILMLLQYLQSSLVFFEAKSVSILPYQLTWFTVRVLGLYLPASIPAWMFYWKISRGSPPSRQQVFRMTKLYAFCWLFFVLLVLAY